ncbi:DUF3999 domain-containing protein [Tahibacter amnicola]|uniref:DUF3999 domain-containing protein n=1 Tax=Tahibacter amnicola TaxID=2976241 RepID=A0ABY6BG77_9GAMM|nr:DUF3999 domain-containing protein [Tahibacter amnicola]UXI69019.1 DUF3999 domain-containing protein [Tahibacter amnicola]
MNALPWTLRAGLAAALVFCSTADAGQRTDYAREWPLTLSRDDGGAYRVTLTEAIYASVQNPALTDIEVFNANGESVPAALFGPEAPLARHSGPQSMDLRWFPLPAADSADNRGGAWELHAERDDSGRVSRVDVRILDPTAPKPPSRAVLLDVSQIHDTIGTLRFEWDSRKVPVTATYVIEESADLNHWRATPLRGSLVRISNNGAEVVRDFIPLHGRYGPYLRLTPLNDNEAVTFTRISADFESTPVEPTWSWLPVDGRRVEDAQGVHFEYELPGRIPAARVDLLPGTGNSVFEWRLSSRDRTEGTWTFRGGPWMSYEVSAGGAVERSAQRAIDPAARDRYWRVDAAVPGGGQPQLRLGYRPEVIVFLAQGPGPFSIAAGSVKSHRADAPIVALVNELRARRGGQWQPSAAYPATARQLAGSQALVTPAPPPRPVDWKSWLLWALLAGGTLVVVGLALQLLRKPEPPPGE